MKMKTRKIPIHLRGVLRTIVLFFAIYGLQIPLSAQGFGATDQLEELLKSLDRGESIVGKSVQIQDIRFAIGTSELTDDSKEYLNKIVRFLSLVPNINLRIIGHTDISGTAVGNQELSVDRASSVRSYLVRAGISKGRLSFEGKGSSEPIADNRTVEGRTLNRRVEFNVFSLKKNQVQAQDLIVLVDDTQLGASYVKIRKDSIEYRTFTDPNVHVISKSRVKSINYSNGHQENIVHHSPMEAPPTPEVEVSPEAPPQQPTLSEYGFWFEYLRGSRVRSVNFEDLDLSDFSEGGGEGRVRLPLGDQNFAYPSHGIAIGMLFGILPRVGVMGEWQYTGNTGLEVQSFNVGAVYDLVHKGYFSIAAVGKLGYTAFSADLGLVQGISGYNAPELPDLGWIHEGDYISARSRKLTCHLGIRGDRYLRSRGISLSYQIGVSGGVLGGTGLFITPGSGSGGGREKIKFRDGYLVQSDGSMNQPDQRPKLRNMGLFFSIGYAGFGGRKRVGY